MNKEIKPHPAAEIFPMMTERELNELTKSIQDRGFLANLSGIVLHDGMILDGRNRLQACKLAGIDPRFEDFTGDDPVAYVVAANRDRRHLSESQRAMVADKIATMKHGGDRSKPSIDGLKTHAEAAAMMNVSKPSVERASKVRRDGSPELVAAVESGAVSVSAAAAVADKPKAEQAELVARGKAEILRAAKEIKRDKAKERKAARVEQKAKAVEKKHPLKGERYRLQCADAFGADVDYPDRIDAIITDPPYPEEFLDCFDDLAAMASDRLAPGGHLLVMSGQSHLPEVYRRLSSVDLKYQWTLAYLTPGQSTQVFGRKVKSNWKPVLWFVKGRNEWEHVEDSVRSDMNDKRFHDWGQSVGGMAQLIERFTVPKSMIVDPFCGAGTTGIAAVMTDRFFFGVDLDAACIAQSAKRIAEVA